MSNHQTWDSWAKRTRHSTPSPERVEMCAACRSRGCIVHHPYSQAPLGCLGLTAIYASKLTWKNRPNCCLEIIYRLVHQLCTADTQCLKITEKISFNIASAPNYFYLYKNW